MKFLTASFLCAVIAATTACADPSEIMVDGQLSTLAYAPGMATPEVALQGRCGKTTTPPITVTANGIVSFDCQALSRLRAEGVPSVVVNLPPVAQQMTTATYNPVTITPKSKPCIRQGTTHVPAPAPAPVPVPISNTVSGIPGGCFPGMPYATAYGSTTGAPSLQAALIEN